MQGACFQSSNNKNLVQNLFMSTKPSPKVRIRSSPQSALCSCLQRPSSPILIYSYIFSIILHLRINLSQLQHPLGSHLPRVIKGYQELSGVNKGYQELSRVFKGYEGYEELSHHQLLKNNSQLLFFFHFLLFIIQMKECQTDTLTP